MNFVMKKFGFTCFNLVFTALIGLSGLTAIPYCFKMMKQEKTKTKIFYILTFIQILLQTTFPFMRAGLIIQQVDQYRHFPTLEHIWVDKYENGLNRKASFFDYCVSVGFRVYSLQNLNLNQ